MSASMLSGAVGGEKRATGWPERSTSHLVKFHLTDWPRMSGCFALR